MCFLAKSLHHRRMAYLLYNFCLFNNLNMYKDKGFKIIDTKKYKDFFSGLAIN